MWWQDSLLWAKCRAPLPWRLEQARPAAVCGVGGWAFNIKQPPCGVARFFVQLPELPKDAPALRAPELPAIKVDGCCRRCEWEAGNTVCCLLP